MKTRKTYRKAGRITAMTIGLFIVFGFSGGPAVAPSPGEGTIPAGKEYTLVRSENNIQLWTRWVPVTETRSARQVMAVFTCEGSLDRVIRVLSDDHTFVRWMKNADKYTRLKTLNDNQWYAYIRFSIPWPLKDQDCVVNFTVEKATDGRKATVNIKNVNGMMPSVNGVTRIPHLVVEWRISEPERGKVRLEYTMFSNQPSKYPRWITDPILQKAVLGSMEAFRNLISVK